MEKNINECTNCEKENRPSVTVVMPECDESTVELPRDEYAEMVAEVTILRVIETLIRKHGTAYSLLAFLTTIIDMGDEADDELTLPASDSEVHAE